MAYPQSAAIKGLGALADPTRRTIFERLAEGPSAVGDLAATMPVSRPAVSQHLKVLKDAGLVSEMQDGPRRIYRLDPRGIARIRAWLDQHWAQALANFVDFADRDVDSDPFEPKDQP